MKNAIKCIIVTFVMVMVFIATGITSEAATVSNLKQTYDYTTSVGVSYSEVTGYKWYGYQIATDASFKNIVQQDYTISTSIYLSGLQQGSTYYVRVGCGTTYSNCYTNWSSPLQVVTTPGNLSDIKFTSANETTATIQYSAAGANIYYIYDYYANKLIATTTNTSYVINKSSLSNNTCKVIAGRKSTSGYVATTYFKSKDVNFLTSKISTSNFGIASVLSASNKIDVTALYSGNGFEVQLVNAGGSKYSNTATSTKSFNSTGSTTLYFAYKQNKFLKYRVRAYVNTDNGVQYGSWSNYKAFCEMNGKYTRGSKKVNFSWSKVTGTGKFKVYVSTKKSSGYKLFKTLSSSKKKITVNKYGKTALKKGKTYYFRIVPLSKINGKYVASDYWIQQEIKIR